MSSITHDGLMEGTVREHAELGLTAFTRLERMLLFAVISECERCIGSEGQDCFCLEKRVSCPFVAIREEYSVLDIAEWKERLR